MTPAPIVTVTSVTRTYGSGPTEVHALQDVSMAVNQGEVVAVAGRSGSGKTTLLNLIGGLDVPDLGDITIADVNLRTLDERGLDRLRLDTVAFVFQSFGLVPMLTAAENVSLPLRLRKLSPAARDERVALLLDLVGLADHSEQRPGELSGGQQQRVAVARALANSPRVLIADEPTGQLDSESGHAVMALLRAIVDTEGMTAIVATHDPAMMRLADRVLTLTDGQFASHADEIAGHAR